jgi:hypothetical protein
MRYKKTIKILSKWQDFKLINSLFVSCKCKQMKEITHINGNITSVKNKVKISSRILYLYKNIPKYLLKSIVYMQEY